MHDVDITAIAAIRQPHLNSDGQVNFVEESPRIATTSLDGSCKVVDLRDVANVFNFGHERGNARFISSSAYESTYAFCL